jgi:LysM repeat protein
VRRGDSLWTISRRHNVSTSELIAMNNLTTSVIYPGDRLTVRR